MIKFNSSISTLGIEEAKTKQAILRLLENSNSLLERINNEMHSRKEDIRLLKQSMKSAIGNVDITDYSGQIVSIQSAINNIENNLGQLTSNVNAAQVSISAAKTDIVSVEDKILNTEEKLPLIDAEIERVNELATNLKNGVNTVKDDIDTLISDKMATLQSDIIASQSSSEALISKVLTTSRNISSLEEKVDTADTDIEALERRVENFTKEDGGIANLNASLDTVDSRVQNADGNIDELSDNLNEVSSNLSELFSSTGLLETRLDNVSTNISWLTDMLSDNYHVGSINLFLVNFSSSETDITSINIISKINAATENKFNKALVCIEVTLYNGTTSSTEVEYNITFGEEVLKKSIKTPTLTTLSSTCPSMVCFRSVSLDEGEVATVENSTGGTSKSIGKTLYVKIFYLAFNRKTN